MEKSSLGAYSIMYVVKNKRSEVLSLLLKNGVVVPMNATDIQIALLVTNLLKVSKSFYVDFSKLLLTKDTVEGVLLNMTGSYSNVEGAGDFCKNPDNKISSPTSYKLLCGDSSTSTSTPAKTSATSTPSPSWLNTGLGIIQTGFQGFLQLDENKTKRDLANASVKISSDEVKKEEITPVKTGLGTGAIVGLSVLGVAVVGLVVYLIAKKK
jgi:hypothetical protein